MEMSDGRPSAVAASLLRAPGDDSAAMDVDTAKEKTFQPGKVNGGAARLLTSEERKAIEMAIEASESLDEIRKLEEQLKMGRTFAA
jgi:U2 small nuclear ribonucleoprotein A'